MRGGRFDEIINGDNVLRFLNLTGDGIGLMKRTLKITAAAAAVVVCLLAIASAARAAGPVYSWPGTRAPEDSLANRIKPPAGFERDRAESGSFAEWLRFLPLKKGSPSVIFYTGEAKSGPTTHAAVVDIDTGGRDLQQCADAVIRLRAEYLFSAKKPAAIHFNFTNGQRAEWTKWAAGYRPSFAGNRVNWVKKAVKNDSHLNFRDGYLNMVFQYAGTASLARELPKVAQVSAMRIGDVFVQGGAPGHAVIVVDMARNPRTGKKVFLLAQSYMPAQSIHILKNPNDTRLSPWFDLDFGEKLTTYEWVFTKKDLKRFE